MATVLTIIEGNIWQSLVTVTDEDGSPVDPGAISMSYILDSDPTTKVTLTYTSATTPAPGAVARTGVGVFVAQVNLASISGTIERYWKTTGTGQATSPTDVIIVPALPF